MAEWPLYVLAFLPSLWKRNKMTLFFAMCELTGGTILQILKHTISNPRPVSVFEDYPDQVLPLVQGVDMHHSNSFPSGHASTFFMFCTCSVIVLAYFFSRKDALKTLRNQILADGVTGDYHAGAQLHDGLSGYVLPENCRPHPDGRHGCYQCHGR
nr:phosphatase PAP2 family protein [Prevotella sp.]